MQTNIQELQIKNNEMIKINSDLIKKVCCSDRDEKGKPVNANIAEINRLKWFISTQNLMVEDLVKQKMSLESKCQNHVLRN